MRLFFLLCAPSVEMGVEPWGCRGMGVCSCLAGLPSGPLTCGVVSMVCSGSRGIRRSRMTMRYAYLSPGHLESAPRLSPLSQGGYVGRLMAPGGEGGSRDVVCL